MPLLNRFPQVGSPFPTEPLDPVQVYNETRPLDWLPMPKTLLNNEIFLLFHIPIETSCLIAFTVTCTGNYIVELGTMESGTFVADGNKTRNVASGTVYENDIAASDFGNHTSTGMAQCMIHVKGLEIFTWEPSIHSKKPSPQEFSNWNIVDMCIKSTTALSIACGNSTYGKALGKLSYFRFDGENSISDMSNMFSNCYSLISIVDLNTTISQKMDRMFNNCYSLIALPTLEMGKVTSTIMMFNSCYSLKSLGNMNTASVRYMSTMFTGCRSLTVAPQMETQSAENLSSLFASCTSLSIIPALDLKSATNISNAFYACSALNKVDLTWSGSWQVPLPVSFLDCSLSYASIVSLFNSLPVLETASTLTLTGNPGVYDLTDEDKQIAINKGWTLTL